MIKMYVVFKKSINFKNDSDTNSEQFFLLLNCNDSQLCKNNNIKNINSLNNSL